VRRSPSSHAALIVAMLALVLAVTGWAEAAREAIFAPPKPGAPLRLDARGKIPREALPFKVTTKPRRGAVLQLGRRARFPARAMPRRVRDSARLGGRRARAYRDRCPEDTLELGSWCLMTGVVDVDREDVGKNNYAFAEQFCARRGGYLPSAGELMGAADEVKLSSTIDDRQLTASIDLDPTDGLRDQREMSSTLITTTSGSSAAGSQGVTQGSRGNPRLGEPDPVPLPGDPFPSTLQYVTVFDNGNKGGFAGGKPVSQPERFRCAFNRSAGMRRLETSSNREANP
jgi:hypothetical protein